ncbi:unnamed protein product [Adineta steineri]|uniref:Uncharacterized protein n=1 Tax=Adineta steineri TaxID=433720 RepID=A0A818GCJ6_9BILA|nr:unnamed protein product [Adineta steineri]CAF3489492.1 unnamed protein product [Adineta steineri]
MMLILYVFLLTGFISVNGHDQHNSELELVAIFDHQVTGVSVHPASGRIFVNFPRWTEDSPVSVAEVLTYNTSKPFPPNSRWNSWRNTRKNELDPSKYFICVQSVVVFKDSLYVLDPAAPATSFIVKGGPKLVEIDLIKNEVKRVILFNEEIAPQGSYLNDIRFSPDGKYAYITDSGATGAIVVVDLNKETAKRVLHGHPITQADPDITVEYNGKPVRQPDGRSIEMSADGIALSIDGSILYWQAVQGKTLYSISTSFLHSIDSDREIPSQFTIIGENGPADGLWISRKEPNLLYVTSIQDNSIKIRNLLTNTYEIKLMDKRLRWPDTFSEDKQGYIYVTTSHIPESAMFNKSAPAQLRTELWKFKSNTTSHH